MHLAYSLPWWLAIVLAAVVAGAAYLEYRRPLSPLNAAQRGVLVALRVLTLASLIIFLLRPIVILPPGGSRDAIVPVLVDVSRSMRLADADGQPRLARAVSLLKLQLMPALEQHFQTELFTVGDGLRPASIDRLSADARRTDLTGALSAIRERYRGQRVAGVVLISDGGDTGAVSGPGAVRQSGARIGGAATSDAPSA